MSEFFKEPTQGEIDAWSAWEGCRQVSDEENYSAGLPAPPSGFMIDGMSNPETYAPSDPNDPQTSILTWIIRLGIAGIVLSVAGICWYMYTMLQAAIK